MNKTPIDTPYVNMEIRDGILYFTYRSGCVINLDIAKEIVKKRLEYSEGISYPLLVIFEGLRVMDKQSRDYFAKDGVEGITAAALVVNSVYTQFFGNMFLRITSTSIPSRLFTNRNEALNWLGQFVAK